MRSKPDFGAGAAEPDPSAELKAENARLIALLEANGVQWRVKPVPSKIYQILAGTPLPQR